ncbi:MAG: 50S ribosomal protein L35 [Chloroflexi bacterium]|nr:50S ribosomal protein L35 [Chloroflexota bacterium]
MPKAKTHKGAQKRLGFTGTGKLMRTKGLKSHLRRKRSYRSRTLYDEMLPVSPGDEKRLRRLLPNGA